MALENADLDRISERNELLFMKLMEKHRTEEHVPMWGALNGVRGDMKAVKIVAAGVGFLVATIEAVGTWVRK